MTVDVHFELGQRHVVAELVATHRADENDAVLQVGQNISVIVLVKLEGRGRRG
jgi:hypothetical protein